MVHEMHTPKSIRKTEVRLPGMPYPGKRMPYARLAKLSDILNSEFNSEFRKAVSQNCRIIFTVLAYI